VRWIRPPRLDLRARVVLFASAVAVCALLLLGLSLRALLANSLYDQRSREAVEEVQRLTGQAPATLAGTVGLTEREVQKTLVQDLTSPQGGGPPSFKAVIVRGAELSSESDDRFKIDLVPSALVNKVFVRSEIAYVYVDSPIGPGRMLVVGAPIRSDQADYESYFFYPLTFQEETLTRLTNFLVIVSVGLLAAVIVMAAILIGRVLRPVQRARDVAEEIAAGNLDARIPQITTHDDFGRLAESFNRMTDALAQKIGELENVSNLQARFVSDVSHELRTPLATVRMAADYIHAARANLPPDAQRAAVLLERELERFENLLEDLLEISRFDAGVVRLEPVEVDLGRLLDEVIDALDPIAHGRKVGVSLVVDTREGAPLVGADPRRLDRVFSNLVKNAIEHTTEGAVRVNAARRDEAVVIKVEDEGEGIPAEDLPHIFERFYRADAHRAKTTGGTGLGLAIALENVHLHGGSITVASEVGKGSVFTVVLPAVKSPSEPCPDEETAAEPQPQPEAATGDGDTKSEAEVVLGG
jgi:two-component system, OmpR family, sensor histidine kinase MtrB